MNTTSSLYTNGQSPAFLPQALDLSYLHAVSGGDKDFEKDMLQSLLCEMSGKMSALQMAIQANDAANVRLQSHSLKNLAGILGLTSLTERFSKIEAGCEEFPVSYMLQQYQPCVGQWDYSKELIAQVLSSY